MGLEFLTCSTKQNISPKHMRQNGSNKQHPGVSPGVYFLCNRCRLHWEERPPKATLVSAAYDLHLSHCRGSQQVGLLSTCQFSGSSPPPTLSLKTNKPRKQSSVNKDKWRCSFFADPGAKPNGPLMVCTCFIDCSDSPVIRQMYPAVLSSLLSIRLCSFCLRCH